MKASTNGVVQHKLPPKPDFIQLPMDVVEDPKLTAPEKVVLMAVLSFAWERKDGSRSPCEAGRKQIAHRAGGMHPDNARKVLRSLEAKGVITSEFRDGRPTVYRVDPRRFCLGGQARMPGVGQAKSPAEVEELQVQKDTPPAPAARGSQNQNPGGPKLNPRALGTSPRQLAEAAEKAERERRREIEKKWMAVGEPLYERYGHSIPILHLGQMENLIRRSLAGKPSKWRPDPYAWPDWWGWIFQRAQDIFAEEGEPASPEEFLALLTEGVDLKGALSSKP